MNCTFETDLCGYIQDPEDDFDWTWIQGGTPSSTTGPGFDHTYGDSSGKTEDNIVTHSSICLCGVLIIIIIIVASYSPIRRNIIGSALC